MTSLLTPMALLAAPAHEAAQAAGASAHAAAPAAEAHADAAHAAAQGPADVLMHHVLDGSWFGFPSKHLAFFAIVALLVVVLVRLALRSYSRERVPRGLGAAVESLVVFVRDEIAEKNIGHDGHKFTSLLCSFFFFILVAALLGLVPLPQYADGHWSLAGTVSTGNLAVTLALAGISFLAQQWAGISKFGVVHHFQNLIPPGLPAWLLPVMIPVEILGMFTKPFALMVRLFANMLAGHMVITALLMLIPLMAKVATVAGLMVTPVSLGLALFIMVLEVLVAFIQAYIFTLLTAIFIGVYAHPAH
jgi:F-type H+-transporting ATPase subunit a